MDGNASGIHIYGHKHWTIKNCYFHDLATGVNLKAGSPHLTCGENIDSTISGWKDSIYNNVFCNTTIAGQGLRVGGGGSIGEIYVHNNLFFNTEDHALGILNPSNADTTVYGVTNLKIYNNTFIGGDTIAFIRANDWTGGEGHHGGTDMDSVEVFNNIFYEPSLNAGDYRAAIGVKTPYLVRSVCDETKRFCELYNMYYGRSGGDYFAWPSGTGHTLSEWQNADTGYGGDISGVIVHGDGSVEQDPEFNDDSLTYTYYDIVGDSNIVTKYKAYHIDTTSNAATGGRGGDWSSYVGWDDPGGGGEAETEKKISGVLIKGVLIK